MWGTLLAPPEANGSDTLMIQDVQLKCDLVDLDDTLDNEYTSFLVSGANLPIHFTAMTTGSQLLSIIKQIYMLAAHWHGLSLYSSR